MTTCSTTVRRAWKLPAGVAVDTVVPKSVKKVEPVSTKAAASETKPGIDPGFVPSNAEEMAQCLKDPI